MYPGYLIYQAKRQLFDAERREADRQRGEIAQALAGLFRRQHAGSRPAARSAPPARGPRRPGLPSPATLPPLTRRNWPAASTAHGSAAALSVSGALQWRFSLARQPGIAL